MSYGSVKDRIINNLLIINYFEGSDHGLIGASVPLFSGRTDKYHENLQKQDNW
jgi:hypothetical protein